MCGIACHPNGAVHHCDICDYGVHVGCAHLPKTAHRNDLAHSLSLLYMNPNPEYTCDVCGGAIEQSNCMYFCMYGCDYGTHVKCVFNKVLKRGPIDEMLFN